MIHRQSLVCMASVALLGSAIWSGRLCAQSTNDKAVSWVPVHLDLDVYPDFQKRSLSVAGLLKLKLLGGSSNGPTLRLGHDLTPYNKHPEFMRFTAVSAAGASIITNVGTAKRGVVQAEVRFAKPKRAGDAIVVKFGAISIENSFEFVITDKVAIGADATGWYARPIQAEGTPWESKLDATPGLTRIHMPTGWRSLATGAFVSAQSENGGGRVESWRQNTQRARSFVIGPYKVSHLTINGMEAWAYELTPEFDSAKLAENVSAIITKLSDRFGPYPYSKYAAAEFPDDAVNWWGDALGDFQVLRTSLVKVSNGGFALIAHEIGHAWWGNSVIPAWPGGYMINEALAGYSALLAIEGVNGRERYHQALYANEAGSPPDYTVANHFKFISEGKDVPLSKLQQRGIDYQISLVKGTFFYHMLRRQVGDEVFFSTLRNLATSHAGKTLSLDELRRSFIEAAPDSNLPQFFQQWLDQTGAPVFESKISCSKLSSDAVLNHVELTQTQPGDAYQFTLTVLLSALTQRESKTLAVSDKTTITEAVAPVCYTAVMVDPNHDLFLWRPEYTSPP
jgi:Peptidase family M1 domain